MLENWNTFKSFKLNAKVISLLRHDDGGGRGVRGVSTTSFFPT